MLNFFYTENYPRSGAIITGVWIFGKVFGDIIELLGAFQAIIRNGKKPLKLCFNLADNGG
jgi:hypothetical protein